MDTKESVEYKLSNAIYTNIIKILEELDNDGKISGSGVHLAQKITKLAVSELRKAWSDLGNEDIV